MILTTTTTNLVAKIRRENQTAAEGTERRSFDIKSTAFDTFVGRLTTMKENQACRALDNLKTSNSQNLPKEVELVENVRYMITTNIKMPDENVLN
jgi:hypothetical protein